MSRGRRSPGAGGAVRCRAALPRDPVQEPGGADPGAGDPDPDPVPLRSCSSQGGTLDGFVVTLPKITSVDQVEAMVELTVGLEHALGLAARSLRFELQIETPQSILGPDGTALVSPDDPRRRRAGHRAALRHLRLLGLLRDTRRLPEHGAPGRRPREARDAGRGRRHRRPALRRLHQRAARRRRRRSASVAGSCTPGWCDARSSAGYYQGWDLHPAQLPTRFAATYAFYRDGFDAAALRLRNYLSRPGSSVMDEPATARALSDFVVRARGLWRGRVARGPGGHGSRPGRLTGLARPRRT